MAGLPASFSSCGNPSHHVDQNVQLEKQPPPNQQTNKPTTPPQKQKKQGVKFFQRIDSKSCRILESSNLQSWDPFGGIPFSRAHRNLPNPKEKLWLIVLCMNPPTAIANHANHPASVENGQYEDISQLNSVFSSAYLSSLAKRAKNAGE